MKTLAFIPVFLLTSCGFKLNGKDSSPSVRALSPDVISWRYGIDADGKHSGQSIGLSWRID